MLKGRLQDLEYFLKTLASGKKVKFDIWPDSEYIQMVDNTIVGKSGQPLESIRFLFNIDIEWSVVEDD